MFKSKVTQPKTLTPPPPPLKLSLLNFLFLKKNLYLLLFTVLFLFFFTRCNPASIINDEAQQLTELIINSNPDATYNVLVNRDDPDTPVIIIYGISNTVLGSPLSLTILINQDEEVITTNLNQFIVTASEIISPYVVTERVSATFGSADPIDLDVIIRIDGATVTDWFTHDTLSRYIDARFAEQAASLSLSENNTLSLSNLTNVSNGAGSIQFKLPPGFEADPSEILLEDPDDADIGAVSIRPNPSQFIIKETARPANAQPYNIADIPLAELDRFIPNVHIRITDDMDAKVSGISIAENDTKQITITGLVNTIGTDKEYTLTISPVQGIFTTPSDRNISITIREPNSVNDFSPGFGTFSPNHTFTVTNEGDASATEYTLVVPFGGAPVRDWLTQTEFSSYFTAVTFAGQTGSLSFDGSSISIDGTSGAVITNVPNGEILLTTTLPTGYSVTGDDALTDPDGPAVAEITDRVGFVTITEVENPNNSEEYPVRINLAAYSSPVAASHVSAMFNGADPSNIEIRGNEIIISGFSNIAGSTGSGSVSITPTAAYTIDPNPFPLSFNDREGTAFEEIVLGPVNVRSNDLTVSHNIIVRLDAIFTLKITNDYVENGQITISEGGTVTIANLGACNVLPPSTIEVVNAPEGSVVKNFPRYFDRRIDMTVDTPPVYQLSRSLIIEDADGNIVDTDFPITMKGFPDCDASAFTSTGAIGTNLENAYIIDTAPKLELLSHLVVTEHAAFANKYYKLTADIDLGLAYLPWSETASGESGEGFPSIGTDGTDSNLFSGTFNCDSNIISNLYINSSDSNIGFFKVISDGGEIKNCGFENVDVTGNRSVGALIGSTAGTTNISNTYVSGSVSGVSNIGGFVGDYDGGGNISSSYSAASVSGAETLGGLVSTISHPSKIINSYTTGSVIGSGTFIGGLVGFCSGGRVIFDSYAIGLVSGNSSVGGLLGFSTGDPPFIFDSYWNTITTGVNTLTFYGDKGRTTAQMQVAAAVPDGDDAVYVEWDATEWQFSNNQYPRLINVACANRQYATDQSIACGSLQ